MRLKSLVFISSTSDFAAQRQAVAQALQPAFDPYLYEEERAGGAPPEERLQGILADTDVFVSVLGSSFGSERPADPRHRSIVEWEFDTAREQGVEILPFMQADALTAADSRQHAFLTRVRAFNNGTWCKTFAAVADLPLMVYRSVTQWQLEVLRGVKAEQPRTDQFKYRLLIPIAMAAAVPSVAVALGSAISLGVKLAVCGLSFFVVLVCVVLLLERGGTDATTS